MSRVSLTNPCPHCGAELPDGERCRERFERCLALDYEHPETYGAVHHLVVACYMLQHGGYTRRGWQEARALVADALRKGVTTAELRARGRHAMDSGRRNWKIAGGETMPGLEQVDWTRSVADVRLDSAEAYRESVLRWAEGVLLDTEGM